MAQPELEERVANLEAEVAELKRHLANGAREKDWRSTVGMFTDDAVMAEIWKEALKYREQDREKARRRYAKRKKSST